MMEEEILSRAIDRLNDESAPGPGDPELLLLARAIRGLRDPLWPKDEDAFAKSLVPRRPRRLLLAAAACAFVALASTGLFAALKPATAPTTLTAFVTAGQVATTMMGPMHAAANAPVAATRASSAVSPRLRLLMAQQIRAPRPAVVLRLQVPPGTRLASPIKVTDLFGHGGVVHAALKQGHGTASIRLQSPGRPGWYIVFSRGAAQHIAFLMPYPAGSTLTGRVTALAKQPAEAGASIVSVSYGQAATTVVIRLKAGSTVRSVQLLVPGSGRERPLITTLVGGLYQVQFGPTLRVGTMPQILVVGTVGALRMALPRP